MTLDPNRTPARNASLTLQMYCDADPKAWEKKAITSRVQYPPGITTAGWLPLVLLCEDVPPRNGYLSKYWSQAPLWRMT